MKLQIFGLGFRDEALAASHGEKEAIQQRLGLQRWLYRFSWFGPCRTEERTPTSGWSLNKRMTAAPKTQRKTLVRGGLQILLRVRVVISIVNGSSFLSLEKEEEGWLASSKPLQALFSLSLSAFQR